MSGRKSRSQLLSSGNISTDLHSMDSGAYDDESLKPNKTAAYHQSTSIESLSKYKISVLSPDPPTPSSLVDNCLENLKIEAEKKQISQQSKQSAESKKVLMVSEESLEINYDVQKGPANYHIHLHFNAPVTNVSLNLHIKPFEKGCQSTNDNLPQIHVKVHSQHKRNSSRSPESKNSKDYVYMQYSKSASEAFISDGQRNVAVKRKSEDDEESNSSRTSRYSKKSKRSQSLSMGRENRRVENEKTCNCKCKGCCCNNASTSKETAKPKDVSGKPFPNRRIADIFDLRNRSRKKEVVKSKWKPKSKTKKNKITKSQRTLSQWVT